MLNEILQYVLLTLSIIYMTLGLHVLLKSWRQKINRLFFLFCSALSLWAFGYAFMVNSGNYQTANSWRLVSALGWTFFYAHWYYFSVEFVGNRRRYVKVVLFMVYGLAGWFFIQTCLLDAKTIFERTIYGWVAVYPNDVNQYVFLVYYVAILGSALFMVYRWGEKATCIRHREQSNLICISVIISLILGGTTDTILPMLGFVIFPMGIMFILVGVSGIWLAIIKYKMMGITAGFIADNVVHTVNTPIFILNTHYCVERANPAALMLLRKTESQIAGQPFRTLFNLGPDILLSMEHEKQVENQEFTLNLDAGIHHYLMTLTSMKDEFGDFISKVIILNDITELKEAESIINHYSKNLEIEVERRTEELESANERLQKEIEVKIANEKYANEMLYFDELTLLPNRLYFKEKAIEGIEEAKRLKGELAVLLMDLDDFKYINESLGHYTGDALLKHVGHLLTANLPDYCVIARNSGDEFHILINGLGRTDIHDSVECIAMNILLALRDPFVIEGKELFITASIGIAIYPEDGTEFIALVKNADSALFNAKHQGKNNMVFSTALIKNRVERMANLRHRLHNAIENQEFCLYYQPQVNLESGIIVGLEALIRWRDPNGNFIAPSEFIPLAEENGLILPIGYWLIETAAKKIQYLSQKGYTHLTMAVNISVTQLRQKDFVNQVMAILTKTGVKPSMMEIEITERVGFKGLVDAEKALLQLRDLGIRISIDDFGTDYSSFMNIKSLPIDKVKIAMEFVSGIEKNSKDAAIVQTMVEMTQTMGLDVVAEGVETEAQIDYLKKINCQLVQGYYYFKPMCDDDELEYALSR